MEKLHAFHLGDGLSDAEAAIAKQRQPQECDKIWVSYRECVVYIQTYHRNIFYLSREFVGDACVIVLDRYAYELVASEKFPNFVEIDNFMYGDFCDVCEAHATPETSAHLFE